MLVHYENIKNIPGLTCLLLILSGGLALSDRGTFFMENQEVWKPVVGYEGLYEVSSLGNVRSVTRIVIRTNGRPHKWESKKIHQSRPRSGYLIVGLNNYIRKSFLIHRLVAQAFIHNPDKKLYVNHINGIKTDNRVENLEWCSGAENANHAFKNNLRKSPTLGDHYKAKKVLEVSSGIIHNSIKEFRIARSINKGLWDSFLSRNGLEIVKKRFNIEFV